MQKFKIPVPLYRTSVHVLIGVSEKETKKYYKKLGGEKPEYCEMGETTEALTVCDRSGLVFILLSEKACHSIVAHEMLHATFYILDSRGIKLNDSSEEAFTYLLGYLMKEYITKTNPKPKKISTPLPVEEKVYKTLKPNNIQVGTIVEHERFGVGPITEAIDTGYPKEWVITVNFEPAGEKKLILKFAKLRNV